MSRFNNIQAYDLMVLDGQGTIAASSPQTVALALRDAQSPFGNAVLVACYQAFIQEYTSLSAKDKLSAGVDVDVSSIDSATSFLSYILTAQPNALMANVSLYLTQLLRYIAHLHPTKFMLDVGSDRDHALLGFSTGMFAASVIASASSVPSLVMHSVEVFRLAFWLGLRAQQYAEASLAGSSAISPADPWSLVVFGASRQDLQQSVDRFNEENVRLTLPSFLRPSSYQT